MTKIQSLAMLVAVSTVALGSCRDPQEDEWEPDGGDFIVGQDDAGPGALCSADAPDLFNNSFSPYIGGEDTVELEVVNFSYFRCPHCREFAFYSRDLWENYPEYQDRVRLYFHHYPFTGETAWKIHASTVAAHNQGLEFFWEMHDYIFESSAADPPIQRKPDDLRTFADEVLGLNMAQYDADMEDGSTVYAFLEWDKAQGQAAGVSGTPKVFICGELLGGWSQLEDVVNSYLELN